MDRSLFRGVNVENAGADSGNVSGTFVQSGAANTKGSWTQLIASTAYEAAALVLQLIGFASTVRRNAIDIGIGGAGSEKILVPDLFINGGNNAVGFVWIPMNVPKGSRISMRFQNTTASEAIRASILLMASAATGLPPFYRATTYGFTSGTTRGQLVDAGASAGTKGAYTQIDGAIANPIKMFYLMVALGSTPGASDIRALGDIAIGAGGSEKIIGADFLWNHSGSNGVEPNGGPIGPFFYSIAAGTRIAVRAASNTTDTGARTFDACILGLD